MLGSSVPKAHAEFIARAITVLPADPRIVGLAAGGSLASDTMDEYSDLDLVVAVDEGSYDEVRSERRRIAESLGRLLAAFTGEHVFEPRLLICLYDGPEPLHVDLKFVSLADVADRVEDPLVLWERDGRLGRALARGVARYPAPDPQWIEDRFWIWVHYAGTKVGRGELFEAIGFLAYLRGTVLGPLALQRAGARPSGVRNLERLAPEAIPDLAATVAGLSRRECLDALRASVSAYRALRGERPSVVVQAEAEAAAERYLARLDSLAK